MLLFSSWGAVGVAIAAVLAAAWCSMEVELPETYSEFQARVLQAITTSTVIDPAYLENIQTAAVAFGTHGWNATVAGTQLTYLLVWPVGWVVGHFLRAAALGFYEFVICRGIASPAAVEQMQSAGRAVIEWQMRRTWKEVLMEIAAIAGAAGLYFLLRFLKRRRYLERVELFLRRKKEAIWMVSVSSLLGVRSYGCFDLASCSSDWLGFWCAREICEP